MIRYLLILVAVLCVSTHVQADEWMTWAKRMQPLSGFTSDCTLKTPIRKCCTDAAAGTCSEDGCQSNAGCTTSPYLTCTVRDGDSGRRCCVDNTSGSACASPEVLCNSDSDCAGQGSNTTCNTAKYPGSTELPGARWECTKTNSPEIVFEHIITGNATGVCIGGTSDGNPCTTIADCTGSPNMCGIYVGCTIAYNTSGGTGNFRFSGRGISLADDASPATMTFSKVTVDDTVPANPYRRAISPVVTFPLEDATTGTWCNFETGACKNRLARIAIGITNTGSTATTPVRIREAFCSYK